MNNFINRKLNSYKNRILIKPKKGVHWIRVKMDIETEKLISQKDFQKFNTLEISGNKWENFNFNSYKNVFYPDFDITKDKLNEIFDLIIAEQVFEHILTPLNAGKNVYSHLKNGGIFLITTPFLIRIHETPIDCYRWTEIGLRQLLIDSGFSNSNIDTFSWGNKKCLKANLKKWVKFNKFFHSLRNERDYPLVVWAIAKKD